MYYNMKCNYKWTTIETLTAISDKLLLYKRNKTLQKMLSMENNHI